MTGTLSSVHLEAVVPMRMASPDPRHPGCDQISRDEEGAPLLVLANVDQLVCEDSLVEFVDTQNDVAESDGSIVPAETARPRGPLTKENPVFNPSA